MIQFLYLSKEAQPFDAAQLRALLRQSRQDNASRGVTGMLLYRDGFFLQVLEGDAAQVRPLIAKIAKDPRHKVLVTEEKVQDAREFREWSMGFRDLGGAAMDDLPGFGFQELVADSSRVKRMLLGFRDQGGLEQASP